MKLIDKLLTRTYYAVQISNKNNPNKFYPTDLHPKQVLADSKPHIFRSKSNAVAWVQSLIVNKMAPLGTMIRIDKIKTPVTSIFWGENSDLIFGELLRDAPTGGWLVEYEVAEYGPISWTPNKRTRAQYSLLRSFIG